MFDLSKVTETQKAYLAGLIDGEGCIAIVRRQPIGANIRYTYQLQLTIVSSTVKLLKWVEKHFGGKVDRIDNRHNHIWRWKCTVDEGAAILRILLPYLVLKRRQAIIALYFYKFCRMRAHWEVTPILIELRERVYWCLRSMHKRKGRTPGVCRVNQ